MTTFNHNGFPIAYQALDNAYPKDTLFIHGNLASKEWWFPSMELLSQKTGTKKLVAADWRGYGDSLGVKDASEIDFEVFAADMVALIEELNMSDVQIVGHSTGGFIAMLAVAQNPALFSNMVLLDSVGPTGLHLDLPKEQVLAHFQQMAENKEYCQNVLAATIKDCSPTDPRFLPLIEKTWIADSVMFQGVIDVLSGDINKTEKIAQLTLPTLILHGDQDLVLPMSMAEETHKTLPNSTLTVVENHGHSLNIEDPKKFVGYCESFWFDGAAKN